MAVIESSESVRRPRLRSIDNRADALLHLRERTALTRSKGRRTRARDELRLDQRGARLLRKVRHRGLAVRGSSKPQTREAIAGDGVCERNATPRAHAIIRASPSRKFRARILSRRKRPRIVTNLPLGSSRGARRTAALHAASNLSAPGVLGPNLRECVERTSRPQGLSSERSSQTPQPSWSYQGGRCRGMR